MTYTNAQGVPAGIIIDITDKTLKRAGFEWTATALPAKRLARMLTGGDVQLWIGLTTLPEFKGKTYIGKSVVEKLVLRAYSMGDRASILKKEDLSGRTALILRGYSYGGWIQYIKDPQNKVTFIEFDSHKSAFKGLMLFSERYPDCFLLNYKHPSEIALIEKPVPDIRYNEISSLDIHFVVSRQMPDAKAVLHRIEDAHRQLKKEGAFK